MILNDTSLAAAVLANGDRQLYFQDTTGSLRRVTRTTSSNQWITNPGPIISSGTRDNTPLAVTAINRSDRSEEVKLWHDVPSEITLTEVSIQIQVYYITEDHKLSRSLLALGGTWVPETLSGYTTKEGTRHLSVTAIKNASSFDNLTGHSTAAVALLSSKIPRVI